MGAASDAILRALLQRMIETERRMASTEIRGMVKQVDPKKAMARIVIAKDEDGEDVLSPWLPYKQIAGDLKIHVPPTVGQTMSIKSASGDIEQGILEPFHWSDENPANSEEAEENVLTFGDVTVTLSKTGIKAEIGGVTFEFTGEGFDQSGGHHRHDGKNTGKDHVHSGVIEGGDDTEGPKDP